MIDFESYAPGELSGQPSSGTQWESKSTKALAVVEGIGVGGSQGLTLDRAAGVGAHYRYSPTAADLGDVFSSNSVVKVSFDLTMAASLVGYDLSVGRFYFGVASDGTPQVLSIDWYANGKIGFNSNGVFKYAKGANGQDFISTPGVFYTVEAVIDYEAKTYTLTVNGVVQTNASGSSALAFRVPEGTSHNPILDVRYLNGGDGNFRPWVLDNIEIVAIPEPGSVGMAAFGMVVAGGAAFRRFRRQG